MRNLWAPWRMEFICVLREEESGCFLCAAGLGEAKAAGEAEDLVVRRGTHCFALMNRYPYSNGHLLIAPYAHTGELDDLPDATLLELMKLLRQAKRVLTQLCTPDGFNIGANIGRDAGAGVRDHFHLHIVPRWRGDTNFMPVLSDTKIIPQALCAQCGELRSAWAAIAAQGEGPPQRASPP